jgi:hypothetical protein
MDGGPAGSQIGGPLPPDGSRSATTGRGPRANPPPARSGSSHSSGAGSPAAAATAPDRARPRLNRRRSNRSTSASSRLSARLPTASTPSTTASPISSRHLGSESCSSTPETDATPPAPSRMNPVTAHARGARDRSGYAAPEVTGQRWHAPQPAATGRNQAQNPPGRGVNHHRDRQRQPPQRVPYRCSRASWSSCSKAIPRAPITSAAATSSAAPRRSRQVSPAPSVGSPS